MAPSIMVTARESWVEITLNRPEKLNSFSDEMHLALRAALENARQDKVRAILLTGAGRGFCAGQDLGDRNPKASAEPIDLGQTVREFYAPLVRQLREMPCPIVCAVNGVAAGAGANIALACDIILAARSAKFVQSFAKVGLIPDTGGSWHLPQRLGEARAKGLALLGEPLSAERAQEWGLIWSAVDDERLLPEARKLTESLAQGPTFGLSATKQAIHCAFENSLDAHLELEADLMRSCGKTEDYAEGVTAFLEKRSATFKGR